ncbi:TetR/AcrR family transcriptional regulator [Rathayibacter sp. VKM Ac-2856]|uniref:TetR/AcrR family transcriptional regulator n=1 Tax=unclassified Rathayibacter TaxID=2609250 RepID=UPI0015665BEE|nr:MULTISPECIES: TetR/AcrR family transcriptional regulator [unclassified Rathayibacter]NQX03450.1 TetR/AcrR family transcriptional regulator [Rathayibacter sp. VKM Ac-2858]NQX18618.1 TetR/AcrR family transcriptional regulator [Rathayibacter sp. VKM Ac-2856]
MSDAPTPLDTRGRIVDAAARLLREQGPAAVTTRGVAESAGLQAPAIYRLFGDKDGLLEAVAEHVLTSWVAEKAAVVAEAAAGDVDPIDDLRAGWAAQVEFGLDNPALFRLLSDPSRAGTSAAARSGKRVLEARVGRVAAAGRLRVPEERAVGLIQTAGVGVVTTLLSEPDDERDPGLAESALEAVLARILSEQPSPAEDASLAAVVAVRALAPRLADLRPAERELLRDWLDRVLDSGARLLPPVDATASVS